MKRLGRLRMTREALRDLMRFDEDTDIVDIIQTDQDRLSRMITIIVENANLKEVAEGGEPPQYSNIFELIASKAVEKEKAERAKKIE